MGEKGVTRSLDILRSENTQDQIISSLIGFKWSLSEEIVSILNDGTLESNYMIENNQLLLIDNLEVSFSKVSDDYLSYY